MEKEISFLSCEKCGSRKIDTIENRAENTFHIVCKDCGHVIHEGPIVFDGPSFIAGEEEIEDIPLLNKTEIKKLNTRELFEKYYFGEICDKYFVDELITRLTDRERVIKLLVDGFDIQINSNRYKAAGQEVVYPKHFNMLAELKWSEKDYALVRKTLKKIK